MLKCFKIIISNKNLNIILFSQNATPKTNKKWKKITKMINIYKNSLLLNYYNILLVFIVVFCLLEKGNKTINKILMFI
jgi:hypothetical protein